MQDQLNLLIQLAQGISAQFGTSCETVIHDLTVGNMESTIVHIENGHVSGRKKGDGPSSVVLEALNKNPQEDHLSYLVKTDDGRILKSSTMYIRGANNTIDYILAINYDITGLISVDNALRSFIETNNEYNRQPGRITHNVNDLLDTLLEQSVELIGKQVPMMTKDEKVAAIQYLNNSGAFLITRSGDKVSNFFGISKFTLYSYIDAGRQLPQEGGNKHEQDEMGRKPDA